MELKKTSMASAAALHIADQDIQNCRFCDSAEHKSENFPDHLVSGRKENGRSLAGALCVWSPNTLPGFAGQRAYHVPHVEAGIMQPFVRKMRHPHLLRLPTWTLLFPH